MRVDTHDFPDRELGRAVPYGIYDVVANTGWVNAVTEHDTAAFAVESIRRWWNGAGRTAYPTADRLLITADAGGSNGYRTRTWKTELAQFAAEPGLTIIVCHLPPGTSKWNRIEHRLFSHLAMNWRGRPLTSHEGIVQSIAATTTKAGLRRRDPEDDLPGDFENTRTKHHPIWDETATKATADPGLIRHRISLRMGIHITEGRDYGATRVWAEASVTRPAWVRPKCSTSRPWTPSASPTPTSTPPTEGWFHAVAPHRAPVAGVRGTGPSADRHAQLA